MHTLLSISGLTTAVCLHAARSSKPSNDFASGPDWKGSSSSQSRAVTGSYVQQSGRNSADNHCDPSELGFLPLR